MQPTVAIIGASRDPRKYGYRSMKAHAANGYEVFPVNPHADEIDGTRCYPSLDALPVDRVDRVSLYVPPTIGITLLDQIARKQPDEVWLNPGSDSPELVDRAQQLGLNIITACSIVDLQR